MPSFGSGIAGTKIQQVVPEGFNAIPDSNGNYTVPGTLVQTFTSSGTYTPGSGVTKVNVVVVGGGGSGGSGGNANRAGGGGSGGGVRVYRDVSVSGPVSVTVGAAATASSFGTLSAPGGRNAGTRQNGGGSSVNFNGLGRGGQEAVAGTNGVQVNSTFYGGGGGGGTWIQFSDQGPYPGAGGAGGGGYGAHNRSVSSFAPPGALINGGGGASGFGGGGGGGSGNGNAEGGGGTLGSGGAGGSGTVLVFVE